MLTSEESDKLWQEFQENPDHTENFHQLKEFFLSKGNWQKLVELYSLYVQKEEKRSASEAGKIYGERASIEEKYLGKVDEAFHSYKKSYSLLSQNNPYLASFIQCCKLLNKWDEICSIWTQQAEESKSAQEKANFLYQVADCCLDKLKNREKAKSLFAQIVKDIPEHDKAINRLELLYLEDNDYENLLHIYDTQIESADIKLKMKRLQQAVGICEQLKKEDKIIGYYQKILKVEDNNQQALGALENIYRKKGAWDELVLLLEKKLEHLAVKEQSQLLISLAEIGFDKLKNTEKAIKYLELSSQLEETPQVLALLEKNYLELEKWEKLVTIYQKQIQILKQEGLKEKYFALAKLYQEKLASPDKAKSLLYKALEIFPKDESILAQLKKITLDGDQCDELLELYNLELQNCKDKRQRSDVYKNIIDLLQKNNRFQDLAEIYEKLLQEDDKNISYYDNLIEIYSELNQSQKRLEMLIKKSAFLKGDEKADIFYEIAQLYVQLKQEDEAIAYYQKIKVLQPNNLTVLYFLLDYYRTKQQYQYLVNVLQQIVNIDSSTYIDGYMEMANIYELHLNNVEAASKSYEKIILHAPQYMEAYRKLRELYKRNNKHNEYIKIVSKLASITPSLAEKQETYFALFEFYHERDLVSQSEEQLLNILEIDSYNKQAITFLKELYLKKQDWKKLINILEKEVSTINQMYAVVEQYKVIASYYQDKLKDIPMAIHVLEKVNTLQPLDIKVLQKLEVLYTQQSDFKKLVEILESKTCIVGEVPQRVNYMYMAAMLWEEKLNNTERAILGYEYVVEYDNQHTHALLRLKKLYKNLSPEKLDSVYEKLSSVVTEKSKLLELHLEAVEFAKEKIPHYEVILQLNPKNEAVVNKLTEIYQQKEDWENTMRMYLHKLSITTEKTKVIALHEQISKIYIEKLHSATKAIEHYHKIIAIDAKNQQTISALEKIYRDHENWQELLPILSLKARSTDEKSKISILLEMGEIYKDKTLQLDEAIKTYSEIYTMQNQNSTVVHILRKLYQDSQDYAKTLQVLGKEIELCQSDEKKIDLLLTKAELCQHYLDQPSVAADALETILKKIPTHQDAFDKLISLYQKREDYEKLLKTLLKKCEVVTPEEQMKLMMRQAAIYEKMENWDGAISIYQQVLTLSPENEEVKKAFISMLRMEKKWKALIDFYENELQQTTDYKKMVQLYLILGNIWLEQLSKYDESLEMYSQVLELENGNLEALRAISRIYMKKQDINTLLSTYLVELGLGNIERERMILLHLMCAEIYEYHLHDLAQAHEHYIKTLYNELDPNNLIAIRGLERIYKTEEKYNELQVMLLREFEIQKESQRSLQLHLEIAQIKEKHVDDFEGAIEFYRVVHEAWPKDIFILSSLEKLLEKQEMWGAYVRILEKKIGITHNEKSKHSLYQKAMRAYGSKLKDMDKAIYYGTKILAEDKNLLREEYLKTIQYMQKVYKKKEEDELLAEMYLKEVEMTLHTAPIKRTCALYLDAGKIYQQIDNDKAISCFRNILHLNPAQSEALMSLIQIYNAMQNWEELLHVYEWTAKISDNEDELINLHLKMAHIWEAKLENNSKALSHYQIAYRLNDKNLTIIKALRNLYEKMGMWSQALTILACEAEFEEESKKAKIYFRMGEICEKKLVSIVQARDNYLKVLDFGFHRKTVEKLLKIEEQLQDFEGMVKILEEDVRKCDPEERIPKMLQLGEIHWQHLHSADNAIRVYTKLLKIDPQHQETLAKMEEISLHKKDWRVLVGILNRQTRNTEKPEELYSLCVKVADIFYQHLHEGNRAIDFYEKALGYKEELDTIHKLQALYEEWGYFNKLIDVLQKLLLRDNIGKSEIYRKLGKIYSDRVFDDTSAIKMYQLLLAEQEDQNAHYALVTIFKRQYLWQELIDTYHKLIEISEAMAAEEETNICFDAAKVYYHYLEDFDNSIVMSKRCLELSPSHKDSFTLLAEILEQKQEYVELARVITTRINVTTEKEEKALLFEELAQISLKHLDNEENTTHYYEKIVELYPDNIRVIDYLEPLYIKNSNFAGLMHIYNLKLEVVKEGPVVADIYFKLAKIYLEQENDSVQAVAHLRMATDINPNHVDSIKLMADILVKEENWTQAIANIEATLKNTNEPNEKFSLYIKLGDIYKFSLDDTQNAKMSYLKALDIDPTATEPLAEVIKIYFDSEHWKEADILFSTLVVNLPEGEKLINCYYQWGITAKKLQKVNDALTRFKNVVDRDPKHLVAIMEIADIYFLKKSFEESLQYYEQAYELESEENNNYIAEQLAFIHKRLANIDKAIHFYQMLLDRNQIRLEALKSLAYLYTKKNESERALLYQQQVLQEAPAGEEQVLANKQMAEIHQVLGNNERSIEFYLKAIEAGGEDVILKQNLTALYIKEHNWEQAKQYNNMCFEQLAVASEKEENRNIHAHILIGLKQNREAILCYQEILKSNPCYIKAIKGIAEIYLAEKNWSALSICYREFLTNLPDDKKKTGFSIHLSLGYLYLEKLNNNKLAQEQFEQVLELNPDHTEALIAITKIKTQDPDNQEEAIKGHFLILRKDPLRLESYVNLHDLLKQVEKEDRALTCHKAYMYLSGKKTEDATKLREITSEAIHSWIVPKPIQEICEMMALLEEYAEKITPTKLEELYSIKRKEHLGAEQVQRPIWYHTHSIMKTMRIPDLHMYITTKFSNKIFLENTTPPSLIISQDLVDTLHESELRFLIAKHLFYVAQKQILTHKFNAHELNEYWRTLYSCFGKGLFDSTEYDVNQKKFRNTIPRKVRKILETKDSFWQDFSNIDVNQYIKYMEYASNRCAFVLLDSLRITINTIYLVETGNKLTNDASLLENIRDIDPINDILLFNISDSYNQLLRTYKEQ